MKTIVRNPNPLPAVRNSYESSLAKDERIERARERNRQRCVLPFLCGTRLADGVARPVVINFDRPDPRCTDRWFYTSLCCDQPHDTAFVELDHLGRPEIDHGYKKRLEREGFVTTTLVVARNGIFEALPPAGPPARHFPIVSRNDAGELDAWVVSSAERLAQAREEREVVEFDREGFDDSQDAYTAAHALRSAYLRDQATAEDLEPLDAPCGLCGSYAHERDFCRHDSIHTCRRGRADRGWCGCEIRFARAVAA